MNKPLILVVEDDPAVARLISTTLETRNYQYHRVQNGAGALLEAASARPDVILLDLGLPDMDGIDVIRKIRGWSTCPFWWFRPAVMIPTKYPPWMPVQMIT